MLGESGGMIVNQCGQCKDKVAPPSLVASGERKCTEMQNSRPFPTARKTSRQQFISSPGIARFARFSNQNLLDPCGPTAENCSPEIPQSGV